MRIATAQATPDVKLYIRFVLAHSVSEFIKLLMKTHFNIFEKHVKLKVYTILPHKAKNFATSPRGWNLSSYKPSEIQHFPILKGFLRIPLFITFYHVGMAPRSKNVKPVIFLEDIDTSQSLTVSRLVAQRP